MSHLLFIRRFLAALLIHSLVLVLGYLAGRAYRFHHDTAQAEELHLRRMELTVESLVLLRLGEPDSARRVLRGGLDESAAWIETHPRVRSAATARPRER